MNSGTSRNTGSDKQTYYKLSLAGNEGDSIGELAETLAAPDVDGDIALCEAAGSARSFFKLVQLGVPFPCNEMGEYVGYQTDHDTRRRATSAGPLTSRYMTEELERSVRGRNIPILNHTLIFETEISERRLRTAGLGYAYPRADCRTLCARHFGDRRRRWCLCGIASIRKVSSA